MPAKKGNKTASLFAVVAKPPRKNSTRKRNFTSGSLTRLWQKDDIIALVQRGRYQSMTANTAMKTNIHLLKSAKKAPRASTVPKSVTKQGGRISLPRSGELE